jgi:hypothetical protein
MKMMRKSLLSPAVLILASVASAQTGVLSGPVAGYVFDNGAQAVRPVLGIPGASTVGSAISAGYSFKAAYVAPRQDSFFGVAADGSTHFFAIAAGAVSEQAIDGLIASPERIVFSPSGTAAALYANSQAQIVTGLPGAPALAGTMALSETTARRGRRTAPSMAVSDDGAYILAALNGAVQLASQNGVVRPAVQTGPDAVMAFAPGGHDAAVAARGTGAILIRDVPGAAGQQILASDGPLFNATAGIAFSADGKRVFVASASQKSVAAFDMAGNRSDFACSCSPVELTPMGTSLRLNELSSDPLWLVDTGVTGPRVVFVPALRAAQ